MDNEELFQQIGEKGDELWKYQLAKTYKGHEIPLEDSPPPGWSLIYAGNRLFLKDVSWPGIELARFLYVIGFPVHLCLDAVHLLLRIVFYPLVLLAWWCEKRLAVWRGRIYFCAICHHVMDEPFVFCLKKNCRQRVQGRLRPYFHSMFLRTCSGCGQSRWLILGQRFLFPPKPLVCRHTKNESGCYHPLTLSALGGQGRCRFVALLGSTVRAKHCVMAHLFQHLTERRARGRCYEPAWRVSALELDLCRQVLCRAMTEETRRFEKAGKHYTLALTFLLQEVRRRRLLVFHNIVQSWLARTELLARNSLNWKAVSGLIFVLDYPRMGSVKSDKVLPDAELYSRLARVVEEYCGLPPGQRVPFRVAVALAVPAAHRTGWPVGPRGELTPKEVREVVLDKDPALHALLVRTVAPSQLRFFGGTVPEGMDLAMTGWVQDMVEWVA